MSRATRVGRYLIAPAEIAASTECGDVGAGVGVVEEEDCCAVAVARVRLRVIVSDRDTADEMAW